MATLVSTHYDWGLGFSSKTGGFKTYMPYLPVARKPEWLAFLEKERGRFVLNASDGSTEFDKKGHFLSFTHETYGEPMTAGISVTVALTPLMMHQLKTLPFSVTSDLE